MELKTSSQSNLNPVLLSSVDDFIPTVITTKIYSLVHESETADVTFEVGNVETGIETFYCHRILFACQSKVFRSMLFGGMYESQSNKSGCIVKINDISPQIFKILKESFYGGDSVITGENVVELLYLSEKYLVDYLSEACLKYIKNYCIGNNVHVNNSVNNNNNYKGNLSLLLTVILKMHEKGMLSIMQTILTNHKFCLSRYQCQKLLFDDKFLLFDEMSAKYLIFDSKLVDDAIISMENKWLLIHRWCKAKMLINTHHEWSIYVYTVDNYKANFNNCLDINYKHLEQLGYQCTQFKLSQKQHYQKYYQLIKPFLHCFDFKQMDSSFFLSKIYPLFKNIHTTQQTIANEKNVLNDTSLMESLLKYYLETTNEKEDDNKINNVNSGAKISIVKTFQCFTAKHGMNNTSTTTSIDIESFPFEYLRILTDDSCNVNDIYSRLRSNARNQVKDNQVDTPIHIWARLGTVKDLIYKTDENNCPVRVVDSDLTEAKIGDLSKWVEIPSDRLRIAVINKMNFDDFPRQLCFEYGNVKTTTENNRKIDRVEWPLSSKHFANHLGMTFIPLTVGTIVDIRDSGGWYASVIHKIIIDNNEYNQFQSVKLGIRYIGWESKYAEWITLPLQRNRIAIRGTYASETPRR